MNYNDFKSRSDALNPKNSFCVIAPAGSGKTEILTQRILRLLADVDKPENIIAITFTRKAANEMIDRIVRNLTKAKNNLPPKKEHELITWNLSRNVLKRSEERNWNLLVNSSRLRIQTIDSFCQTIVNDLPILSRFGGNASPTENADLLYNFAVENLFSEIHSDSLIASHLQKVLLHFDNDFNKLKNLFVEMIKCRDQWLPYALSINNKEINDLNIRSTLDKWFNEKLTDVKRILIKHEDDLISILNFIAPFRKKYNDDSEEIISKLIKLRNLPGIGEDSYPLWSIIFSLFFTSDYKLRKSKKSFTKKQGFPPKADASNNDSKLLFEENKNTMESIINSIRRYDDEIDTLKSLAKVINFNLNNQNWSILTSICKCLVHLYAELRLVFGSHGLCDFLEINNSALIALSGINSANLHTKDESIRHKWDSGIKHILIDEFQDTSVSQYKLIEKLTEEWTFYNAQNNDKKTLFIVGDPMQSIYSFRAAKVGLFLQAKEYGIGDIKLKFLELKSNFRSSSTIVNWNNEIFSKIFPSRIDLSKGAVTFSESYGINDDIDDYTKADITLFDSTKERKNESQKVVNLIKECQTIDPCKTIAILVRAKSHLNDIIPALEKENIRWAGNDLNLLSEREAVMDCISLTKVFVNPSDKLSWLSLIHSPFCGITLKDIQHLADANYHSQFKNSNNLSGIYKPDFYHLINYLLTGIDSIIEDYGITKLSNDGLVRLKNFAEIIRSNWSLRGIKSLRGLIEDTWFDLQGLLIAKYSFSGDERLAVQSYFNLLEDLDEKYVNGSTSFDLSLLEIELQSLYSDGLNNIDTSDECLLPQVEIMTIHKSKGLEFDTVIIPGLDKVISNNTKPLLHWNEYLFKDRSRGFMMSPIDPSSNLDVNDLNIIDLTSDKPFYEFEYHNELNPSILYKILSDEKKEAVMVENIRLIYVASTRAKSRLHLLGCLDFINEELKPPKSNSLLSCLWPSVLKKFSIESLEHKVEPKEKTFPLFKRPRKEFFASDISQAGSITHTEVTNYKRNTLIKNDNTKIILGITAHEVYELIINNKELFVNNKIQLDPERWRYRLISLGFPRNKLNEGIDFLNLVIVNASSSEVLKWIIRNDHKFINTEWDLTSLNPVTGKFVRNIIDCSFIDKDNCRWIIDFKFNEPKVDESFEKFKRYQIHEYEDQLNNYYNLVRKFDESSNNYVSDTRMCLFFPLIDEKVEIINKS